MTRPEESIMFRWIDRGLSVAGRESGVPTGLESGGVIATRHLRGALQIRHPFGVKMPGVHHLQFNGLPDHLHPLLSAWHLSSDTDS
jgi:hypothetical protein